MKPILITLLLLFFSKANADYKKELKCLKDIILYEANGEPKKGKIAVGYVGVKRAKSKLFPGKTICAISHQAGQFEFHKYKHKMKRTKTDKRQAARIAGLRLAKKVKDPLPKALYFRSGKCHSFGIRLGWIGKHCFSAWKKPKIIRKKK